jgi:hypothetical protein
LTLRRPRLDLAAGRRPDRRALASITLNALAAEIVIRPAGGLCNRLSVVSSCAVLARRCDRELKVCWTPGPGWSDEDLDDLFENRFSRVSVAEFEHKLETALCLHDTVRVEGIGGLSQVWRSAGEPGFAAVFDDRTYPVVAYHSFRRCQDLLAPEVRRRLLAGFEREFVTELRGWRPVRAIRERVDGITDAFAGDTVGVHIRRGDAFDHPTLSAEYRRSTDAAFIARLDRIVRSRPASSFFLATDSETTQEFFRDRYGDRILADLEKRFVPSVYNERKDNQRDAVVDLFALARTRMILGSHYSTFSQSAALLGGVRLRVVVEDSRFARLRRLAARGRNELVRRGRSWRVG